MLIALLRSATEAERERLADFLARRGQGGRWRTSRGSASAWKHYGCLEYARQVAHGLAGAADARVRVLVSGSAGFAGQAVHRGVAGMGLGADVRRAVDRSSVLQCMILAGTIESVLGV
jgi:hypothetical protein